MFDSTSDSLPRSATPSDFPSVFELLFQHLSAEDRAYRIKIATQLLENGQLDPAGLFVYGEQGRPTGVILCQSVTGGGGLIWPPMVQPDNRDRSQESLLIRRACDYLRTQGAYLAQCLVPPQEYQLTGSLLEHGFVHVTDLHYLKHNLYFPLFGSRPKKSLRLQPYNVSEPNLFHTTLEQTYEQTLDCPEVNGLRTVEEVIAGHKAQGRFDPSYWWLAWKEDHPVGVLILLEQSVAEWEVAYLGVIPSARRTGVAREMLDHALRQAKIQNANGVTLSVDRRNTPARGLYERLGFETYDQKHVLLYVWGKSITSISKTAG